MEARQGRGTEGGPALHHASATGHLPGFSWWPGVPSRAGFATFVFGRLFAENVG